MEYSNPSAIEDSLLEAYLKEATKQDKRKKKSEPKKKSLIEEPEPDDVVLFPGFDPKYLKYQNDPVGFIEKELREKVTPDIARMLESVRDFTTTHGRSANSVGKTHGIARLAVWWYMCHEGSKVYTSAAPPESNLRNLLWSEIGTVVERNPKMFEGHAVTSMHIQRNKAEFITGVLIPMTGTPAQRKARFSGKHAPYLLFILDEGDAIPSEVYEAIESCMSGGHARLCVTYNPRASTGPVYTAELNGQANIVDISAFTHPNVTEDENIIPGAVTRDVTVLRLAQWSRPVYAGEDERARDTFEVPDFLVGARATDKRGHLTQALKAGRRKVTEHALYYMVLARYPPGGANQLIHNDWVEAARARWDQYVEHHGLVPPDVRPILGHDVASEGEDMNCVYLRYDGFVMPPEKWKGVDARASGDRGAAIGLRVGAGHCFIDSTGVGAGAYGAYRVKGLPFTPVKSMSKPTKKSEMGEFYRMRDQVLWSLREWLKEDPTAMLPPSELLLEELRTPTYEESTVDGKIHVMQASDIKSALSRSPDEMMALAMTFAPPRKRKRGQGSIIVARR